MFVSNRVYCTHKDKQIKKPAGKRLPVSVIPFGLFHVPFSFQHLIQSVDNHKGGISRQPILIIWRYVCERLHLPLNVRAIRVRCTACDVISFNGHQQDRHSTCARGRDLSNNGMNMIQSYRSEKNADKYMMSTQKFQ